MDWFNEHSKELSEKYPGKHLAIVDNKVVAVGDSAVTVFREAKSKFPDKKVSLAYIPTDEELVTVLWILNTTT